MDIYDLRCESMRNPIGIECPNPRLTWKLTSDRRGVLQTAYRVIVSMDESHVLAGIGDYYDSSRVDTNDNACILGRTITSSGKRYYWSVMLWDEVGRSTAWAEPIWFEMGLMHSTDWENAEWIEPPQRPMFKRASPRVIWEEYPEILIEDERRFVPCQLLRKEFLLNGSIRSARAYASAHGLYQLEINGKRIGCYELSPEVTPYDKYLQYQTYDITAQLQRGSNAVGIHLANGWWSGLIGLYSASCQYGDTIAAILKVVVQYEDGQIEEVVSDNTFKCAESPIRYAEIFVGEKFDASYMQPGWSSPGFDDRNWQAARSIDYDKHVLRGQNAEHISVVQRLNATRVLITPAGERLIDFGQVFAGKARITLRGKAGTVVRFRHTEELDEQGNFARLVFGFFNQSTDTYILRGDEHDVYEPKFVYHGFRYISVEGDVEVRKEDCVGLVLASAVDETSSFECSDSRVTRLHENVKWTALGNFISIPTDNPDRERAGWTGDAQMIVETACYFLGLEAFWRRWLKEMALEQKPDGQLSLIVPNWKSYDENMTHHRERTCSSAWGDVCVILPWVFYQRYGDKRVLEDAYPMMQRWIEYVRNAAETRNPADIGDLSPERAELLKYIWNTGFHYGDWLTPSFCIDKDGNFKYLPESLPLSDFTPSCYYKQSTEILAKIARIIGRQEDAAYYENLSHKIKDACEAEFFDDEGNTKSNLQGAQVFSVHFDIAPEGRKDQILDRLVSKIAENGGRMDTGFSSTQYLLDVLAENGRVRDAYDRLFSNQFPSWLYEVERGATGIWESWQAIQSNGKVNNVSFMQYANGVVGDWLYSSVAGIRESEPGFRKITICPMLDKRLDYVRAEYRSVQGPIKVHWSRKGNHFDLFVDIPANTMGEVIMPNALDAKILENNLPVDQAEGVIHVKPTDGKMSVGIGSGKYMFSYDLEGEI